MEAKYLGKKKEKSDRFGEILAKWNAKEIDPDTALYEITKLYPRIFMRGWSKLISSWSCHIKGEKEE